MKGGPLLAGFCAWLLAVAPSCSMASEAGHPVFHEWGTFTAFQNERGESIGFLNTDDEPVPSFVRTLPNAARLDINRLRELPSRYSKGLEIHRPDVTLRLETPVLYTYLPESTRDEAFDVKVDFLGGWLTQYFPDAVATASGSGEADYRLEAETRSSLLWRDVKVRRDAPLPATESAVWLAPRAVEADTVEAGGQSEKYLFYRGVGNLSSPLQVIRSTDGQTLRLKPTSPQAAGINKVWLIDIRPDGTAAWRAAADDSMPATFKTADYSRDGVNRFRAELEKALVGDGLFRDEAAAMMETWAASYFRTGGMRLFFLVPRAWTEHVLPLSITFSKNPQLTESATVTRVMVGRVELLTPEQRALVSKIKAGPAPESLDSVVGNIPPEKWVRLNEGARLAELGFTPEPIHQAYLDLGRFRNAILLHEASTAPTPELLRFLEVFGIRDRPE